MRFRKIYLEITNVCNLRCSFCPGTSRAQKSLNEDEFELLTEKLRPYSDYLYFHLMGEPLCHPKLEKFFDIADGKCFRVIITTNGTLLEKRKEVKPAYCRSVPCHPSASAAGASAQSDSTDHI